MAVEDTLNLDEGRWDDWEPAPLVRPRGMENIVWWSNDNPANTSQIPGFMEHEDYPFTTHLDQLHRIGMNLPDPDTLSDEAVSQQLQIMIDGLAKIRVFLSQTDHLNDRELYRHLWEGSLREPVEDMPMDINSAWHLDILGGCSEEDLFLMHKYYESPEDRTYWQQQFPEEVLPPHQDPPFDRDRQLPKAEDARLARLGEEQGWLELEEQP
jgi:hypothetical protein